MVENTGLNINWALGTPAAESPAVAEKKARLQDSAIQKMAVWGSPQEQRAVVTAEQQGNRLADDQAIEDIWNLNPAEYSSKYGADAEQARWNYRRDFYDVQDMKNAVRSGKDVAKDSAIDAGLMAANTVGGVAALGANAVDAALGTTMSPHLSQGLDWLNQKGHAAQSDLMQARREQHALEGELDRMDRQARYEERAAESPDSSVPWLKKQGEAIVETVGNYADDPIMAGSLVPEGIGSLLPATAGIKLLGRANALRVLASRGMARGEASQFLKTAAGKTFLEEQTVKAAPLVIGLTESGGAVHQSQLDILSLSDEELSQSNEYKALRAQNMSHEEARMQLAREAGSVAGVTAAPGALLAGKIAAPFAANPLRIGPNRALSEGIKDVASETIEEGLQEANSQVSSNIGAQAIGLDRALDEGVAEAAAEGALGGIASAGPMQAPGVAASIAVDTAKAGLAAGQRAVETSQERAEARQDERSPVGTNAREKAAESMEEAGSQLVEGLKAEPQPAPEEGSNEVVTKPEDIKQVQDTLIKGLFLDAEELQAVGGLEDVAARLKDRPDAPVRRSVAVEAMGKLFNSKDTDQVSKTALATQMMNYLDEMRRMDSRSVNDVLNAEPEDSQNRALYDVLKKDLAVQEQSSLVKKARNHIASLSAEEVHTTFNVDALKDENTPAEAKEGILAALSTIARINPEAVSIEDYDLALDQVGSGRNAERLKKQLFMARKIVEDFKEADDQKARIEENQKANLKKGERLRPTSKMVREQINVGGNKDNQMPSLEEHRNRILDAAAVGRYDEAERSLKELRNFVQSQANKMQALNESFKGRKGRKAPVAYEAYGPFGFFEQSGKQGVFVDPHYVSSIAFAQDVHVDATVANKLLETLTDGLNMDLAPVDVPALPRQLELANEILKQAENTTPNQTEQTDQAPTATAEPVADEAPAIQDKEEQKPLEADPEIDGLLDGLKARREKKTDDAIGEQRDGKPDSEEAVQEEQAQAEETPVTDPEPEEQTAPAEEVETEDKQEPEEAPVKAWFEGLKNVLVQKLDGFNVFLNAFKPGKNGSVLPGLDDPMGWIADNAASLDVSEDVQSALIAAIEADFRPFAKRFQAAVKERLDYLNNKNRDLDDSLTLANMLPMNFVVRDPAGDLIIEPKAMAATFAAAYEWLIANAGPRRKMDDEQINKMFGKPRGSGVTSDMRQAARFGVSQQAAVENISMKMMDLLDVRAKDDVSIRETQGLFRSMALNALEIWTTPEKGKDAYIETYSAPYQVDGVAQSMLMMRPAEFLHNDPIIGLLKEYRDPFTRIFTNGRVRPRYIGKAPEEVADSQIGNRLAKLSAKEQQVVRRLQDTPSYLNTPMVDLVEALGSKVFNGLLGYTEMPKGSKYSKGHALSIDGKNQTLEHDLNESLAYVKEVRQTAGSKDAGSIPIFFEWMVSSVGRLQQVGPVTPQGSKTAREMISATNATLDLTDPVQADALWLAVAQSIGVKIESLSKEDAINKAQEMVQDPNALGGAVTLLQQHLNGVKLDAEAFKKFLDASGEDVSPKLIHAVLTVARANESGGTAEEKAFKTALALEADGKTDGPVNAMIHMGTGPFTPEEIERFAKGGLFFTSQEMSLNDFIDLENQKNQGKEGWKRGLDLYHMAAALFEKKLGEVKDPKQLTVLRVLDQFLPDFTLGTADDNGFYSPEIGRNVTKNPLTVFLYGSGDRGIAGKVASAVAEGLDTLLTELAQSGERITAHKAFAENPDLVQDLADLMFRGNAETMQQWLKRPLSSEVTSTMHEALTDAILEHFAQPMLEAVDDATGGLASSMKFTQKVATVQTLIFQDVFRKKIADAQQAKDDAQNKAQDKANKNSNQKPVRKGQALLSENEIRDVFAETMKIAPIYGTDVQNFHIAAPKKHVLDKMKGADGKVRDIRVAQSFSGKQSSRGSYIEPADASVKVSPYLTIGTGDGRMIMNIYLNGDGTLDTSLPVFDGVELAADRINEGSLQINESVFKGWMEGNPYEAIANGFDQLMAYLDKDSLDAMESDTFRQLAKTMGLKKNETFQMDHLESLQADIREMANSAAARKTAMKRMASSTDHMAGAQAPYVNQGVTADSNDPTDYEGIWELLEGFRLLALDEQELRKETKENVQKVSGYAQAPNEGFLKKLSKIGEQVQNHDGVSRVKGKAVMSLLSNTTGTTADQKGLLKELAGITELSNDMEYFFGSPEDLEALRKDMGIPANGKRIQLGLTYPNRGITFISNASPETLLHEILHGYTAKTLTQHYKDPESSPEHVRFAVARLEEMMDEVQGLVTDDLTDYDASALTVLQEVLSDPKMPMDHKISELISYMLTNPDLIEKGKKVTTYRPLMSFVRKGLELVKRLLGIKTSLGKTLYSTIRASTSILIHEAPAERDVIAKDIEVDEALSQVYGEDARLSVIERTYLGRLKRNLDRNASPHVTKAEQGEISKRLRMARRAAELANSTGFALNPREARAFEAIHAAVSSGLKADQPVQRHLYEAFSHVAKTLTAEDILKAQGLENNPTVGERLRANMMKDFLIGARGMRKAADGRSDMLAVFVALSQVSPDLRQALSSMKPPKAVELKWDSVDDWLRSIGTSMINLISRMSLKPRLMAPTLQREMDLLSKTLTEVQADRRFMAAVGQVSEMTDKANMFISDRVAKASEKVSDDLLKKANRTNNRAIKTSLNVAALVSAFGSKQASADHGEGLTTMLNHAPGMDTLRSLLSDLRGMTDSNTPLMRLINPVKAQIDALRQDFREGVPEELAKTFTKRRLTREEWSRLHQGVAKVDLLALGHQATLDLLKDPSSLSTRISELEEQIDTIDSKRANRYKDKARALATFMVDGKVTSQHLLRNAHSIAHLYGERDEVKNAPKKLVEAIDKLTSLYAFEQLDEAVKQTVLDLVQEQPEGIQAVTGFLNSTRAMELQRRDRDGETNLTALNNGWKGYVPSVTQEGTTLIVAFDTDFDKLTRRGFERVGDYNGDKNEGVRESRGYYQSTVGGRNAFRQGIAQTVHETWQGVDARTGQTQPGMTAGLVLGADAQDIAEAASKAPVGSMDGIVAGEYLMPILNSQGKVVAYERAMDPEKLNALPKDTHLGRMLGIWAGRILEENAADEFNSTLVKTLKDIYDQAVTDGREDEFVNLADPKLKDQVAKDAWNGLGWRIKEEIRETFGSDFFPVRQDMRDDAVGYRAASLTDPWTGISRWSPETQKHLRTAAEFIFKENTFKRLRQGENLITDLVSYAKTTIIVRSVVVGVDNVLSNFLHLALKGVSIPDIATGTRNKFTEITEYVKNREEIQRLQVKLGSVIANDSQGRQISARIQALEEANERLSIAPLIKAGEFSTISENLTEADVAIREGRWGDFMEKAVDKLPGWSQTAAKNVLITKDTALFQGLNRMVQYGDFVAKAVLYDHLTQKKGMTEREALDQIFEEFVAYNRLPGRGRDFLESMGVMWFWNYKIRIMKVMANTIRERPLNALMMMGGVAPQTGIQSVWDGSLLGAGLDGRLDYSIGPEMGFQAPTMHPVWLMAN